MQFSILTNEAVRLGALNTFKFVPVQEIFMGEIITGLKVKKNQEYFSIFRLIDIKVRLLLLYHQKKQIIY